MILIRELIYFISIVSNLALGFFVLSQGRKKAINRTFFAAVVAASGWLISLFLFYGVESPDWVLWLGRFNFAVVLPMFYYLLEFALVFPRKITSIPRRIRFSLHLWLLLFTALTLLTPLVGKDEIITAPGQRETIYGPLYPLYVLHYIAFSVGIGTILFHKLRKLKEETEKNQIRYLLVGLSLALLFGFTTNILLYSLGLFEMANYGPLATVIFSGFVTAAILKYHLFDIKVILTGTFVVILAFILFIQTLLAEPLWFKFLNLCILFLFSIFGYLLIQSVSKEIRYREQLAKAYAELKKLDVAKTEFISIASHQLRTPLAVVKGYVSRVLRGSYGAVPEKAKQPLESVYQSNERLIKLVEDLLNVSRIETGKLELTPERVSLEEIISSVVEELKIRAGDKNLYLRWEKPKKALPKIMIDKEKIRQALFNVVDNAIKYTERGGVTIELRKHNSSLLTKVSDTGVGLTKEELPYLFESFSRGKAGVQFWPEGIGLGLYIARRLLEMHNGRIWAGSKGKGKGSTFFIKLPLRQTLV